MLASEMVAAGACNDADNVGALLARDTVAAGTCSDALTDNDGASVETTSDAASASRLETSAGGLVLVCSATGVGHEIDVPAVSDGAFVAVARAVVGAWSVNWAVGDGLELVMAAGAGQFRTMFCVSVGEGLAVTIATGAGACRLVP